MLMVVRREVFSCRIPLYKLFKCYLYVEVLVFMGFCSYGVCIRMSEGGKWPIK